MTQNQSQKAIKSSSQPMSKKLMNKNWLPASILALSIGFMGVANHEVFIPTAHSAVSTADFSQLVKQVTPAVARVNVTKKLSDNELAQDPATELLRQFFGNRVSIPEPRKPAIEYSYGTAFFITKDGYMLTNHHVVDKADKITVTLNDRTELDATLVGSDERSDVAVLKVSGTNYPSLPIGNSDALQVGEPVLAIGSPFGFDYSASAGIVSAKSRNFSREVSVPFIQTDVALNPGNSGGPLFNQRGEVVGINSRIFSGTGGYMGLSFSIPINSAMDIYEQLKNTGKVQRAYLGVYPQDIDRNLAEAYHLKRPQGALLTKVLPNSAAERAGLQASDIILEYNGQTINETADLLNLINRAKPKDRFTLLIQRNGKRQTITGTLDSAPNDVKEENPKTNKNGVYLGLSLRDLQPNERSEQTPAGVYVTAVDPTGLAARSGLQAGDIITSLHDKPITNAQELFEAISHLPKKGVVTVEVLRQGNVPIILGLRIE